jgi:hypothetical protein
MKRMLWILPLLILLLAGGFFISSSRASTETAPYTVLETDDKIEVRLYDTLHLAKVSLPASDPKAENMDGAFMKLFRFIDGANDTGEKIAMTTPVIMQRTSTESSMSFVMPKAVAAKGAPKPKGDVTLDQLPSVKVDIKARLNSLFVPPAIFVIELLWQKNQRNTANKLLTFLWQISSLMIGPLVSRFG